MSSFFDRIANMPPEKRALLERRLKIGKGQAAHPGGTIRPRGTTGPCPLSFAQERLWILEQLRPGSAAYNLPVVIPMNFPISPFVLESSINKIVSRHESLRTTFTILNNEPVQLISSSMHVPLEFIDLSSLPPTERYSRAQDLAARETQQPFDLSQGPLLRTVLLRISQTEHVLLLTMHHIVSDGWSMGIFFRELSALYQAACLGTKSPLPDLTVQYADFAAWQREWLQGERMAAQLAYWRKKLAGAPPLLELCDKPRPRVESYRGAAHTFSIPAPVTSFLRAISQETGTTMFMTLLAGFLALLSRYTGQEDLVVGSPIANRTRAEIENLIGFFVNMLVLRNDLSGDPSFVELLKRVKAVTVEAYANQDLPFEKLVEELKPERNLSHNSLFQIAVALQNISVTRPANAPPDASQSAAASAPPLIPTVTAKFDLTLSMFETEQEVLCSFEYNTDLFEPQKIARLAEHFQILLESAVAAPNAKISELNLLSEQEKRLLLHEWNATGMEFQHDRCVHELFEAQVTRTPDATALICEDEQLTYRELNERANQLAHYLRRRGVKPEGLVAILMQRSIQMVVAFLGVLKAGGAYVPVDPTYPPERIRFMLQNSRASVLLTVKKFAALAKQSVSELGEANVLNMDEQWNELAIESRECLPAVVRPDNLAYMIYTSGSMGTPKGTMNLHRSLCNLLQWTQDAYALQPTDRVLQKTAFSFDPSTWEILWALLNGATLVLAPADIDRNPSQLVRFVQEQQISVILFVSSAMQVFLEEPRSRECSTLRHVFCGGEPVPASLQAAFESRLDALLHNIYGPTEACIITIVGERSAGVEAATMPIGRPVGNTRVYLLDRRLRLVPLGVTGEVFIGGHCLGRGYYFHPALTAEQFVPDPFSSEPGARLYKTGDLARYLSDGQIEFLRRADQQVKVRGFRIELGEVEAALMRHQGVRHVVVCAHERSPGNKQLVAYVEAKEKQRISSEELRQFLEQLVPRHLVPDSFIVLDAMPLTPNGKIDREALPDPHIALASESNKSYVAPRTSVETELARIWSEVLGCDRIGIHDNFFDLGGHSLTAVQVISRVRVAFNLELPLHHVFETPTIAELAVAIVRTRLGQHDGGQGPELLNTIEGLSEVQVRSLLEREIEA
jgi:amino acid adenylation domain-containing protein